MRQGNGRAVCPGCTPRAPHAAQEPRFYGGGNAFDRARRGRRNGGFQRGECGAPASAGFPASRSTGGDCRASLRRHRGPRDHIRSGLRGLPRPEHLLRAPCRFRSLHLPAHERGRARHGPLHGDQSGLLRRLGDEADPGTSLSSGGIPYRRRARNYQLWILAAPLWRRPPSAGQDRLPQPLGGPGDWRHATHRGSLQ